MASPFDLVNLANLKSWLDITGAEDDLLLAQLISQISRAILNILERPAILPSTYTETYDGGGEASIVLRQWPVNDVISCAIDGVLIPPAPPLFGGNAAQPGYFLDPSDSAPPGAMQRLSLRGRVFTGGIQNVVVSYAAGYQITNENAAVPASPPYTIQAQCPYGAWASDVGVVYASGQPLTGVQASPAAAQYSVTSGLYSFSQADAGTAVSLAYGYVPYDLALSCMDWIADRYAYRSRIGQRTKSLGGQETLAFIVKDIPDFVRTALSPYRRVFMP
jgi:hypothetical protein